VGKKEVIHEVI